MNRSKIRTIIAALSATIMFTGCGATTETKAPLEVVGTVPSVTITTLETMPATETKQYEFGDLVYSVEREPDGSYSASRHAVVAHEGDVVIVTNAISDSSEALRECLPEYLAGGAETWAIDASELYNSWEQAQEVADEMMSGR